MSAICLDCGKRTEKIGGTLVIRHLPDCPNLTTRKALDEIADTTPYGRDGDWCPWCGADWKAPHDEDCPRPREEV